MITFLSRKPTPIHVILLFIAAFIIRAAVFTSYITPNAYYHQPDSGDYHIGALCIATGHGMFRPDIKQPIFWRTPGYSYFLHFFYKMYGFIDGTFEGSTKAQQAALWVQILLNALVPLLLFALACLLTGSCFIAWLVAGISIIHPGFILASEYLLSEGPSLLFFYIFLYVFFALLFKKKVSLPLILIAAASLGVYTWMRPMGQWVGIIAVGIILICSTLSFKKRMITAFLFILLLLGSLAPWYVRNYRYTHELFFNPTLGPYLTCFSVPKILRRLYNIPLDQALKISQRNAAYEVEKTRKEKESQGLFVSQEACKRYAIPVITKNIGYFAYDWITECIKTTFDLYSYQLVSLATNTYSWDPLEEQLLEKITAVLWSAQIPAIIRIIGWFECIFMIFMWIGIIRGMWIFMIKPLWYRDYSHSTRLWLAAFLLCGAIIGMTGGFGYARLRLPIEPLMIILGLMALMQWWSSKRFAREDDRR